MNGTVIGPYTCVQSVIVMYVRAAERLCELTERMKTGPKATAVSRYV